MRRHLLVGALLVGCSRKEAPSQQTAPIVSAVAAAPSSASTPVKSECAAVPGVVIPGAGAGSDIRIAAAGSKAFVTYWELTKGSERPNVETASGQVFDAADGTFGPKLKLEENSYGDMPVSAAVPLAVGNDLFVISCSWAAPSGQYACMREVPGSKATTLFSFTGIANGGPDKPDIAAVVKGEDSLVVVPAGNDLMLFSARVSAKKKDSPFAVQADMAQKPAPDAFVATLSAEDEVTVVYRHNGAVKARRAGFDQKWRGPAVDLSVKGSLVGAPVVTTTSDGGRVVALFSQRAKASDPWRVVAAELAASNQVTRTELPTGAEQAQGPGIARSADAKCFYVSWVEGTGKTTRTKLGRLCNGAIAPDSIVTLSTSGIEGGRAYLAPTPTNLFVVWQELPAGKAEYRVARLNCK